MGALPKERGRCLHDLTFGTTAFGSCVQPPFRPLNQPLKPLVFFAGALEAVLAHSVEVVSGEVEVGLHAVVEVEVLLVVLEVAVAVARSFFCSSSASLFTHPVACADTKIQLYGGE